MTRQQFDAIYALLEGVKQAAKDGSTEVCKSLAQSCQDIMTGCTIGGEIVTEDDE